MSQSKSQQPQPSPQSPEPEAAQGSQRPPQPQTAPAQATGQEEETLQEALQRHEREREQLQAEAERLRREVEMMRDMAMRTQADLENYRKRVQRELEEERRFAELELIRDLLPVCDNLERALQAARSTQNVQSLIEGFQLVAQQLQQVLRQHHCQRIDPQGQPFDPHQHEAVASQPTEDLPPKTVLQVVRPGYLLHDRVIRPAQVIVAGPPAPGDGTSPSGAASPTRTKPPAEGEDGKLST